VIHLSDGRHRKWRRTRPSRASAPQVRGGQHRTHAGSGAGGYRTHDQGIMSRRRSVRVVPDCAIYQRFVRWSVRLVMPCVAVCRRVSWMESWIDRPPSSERQANNDSSSGSANSSCRSALPRNEPLDRRRRPVADHALRNCQESCVRGGRRCAVRSLLSGWCVLVFVRRRDYALTVALRGGWTVRDVRVGQVGGVSTTAMWLPSGSLSMNSSGAPGVCMGGMSIATPSAWRRLNSPMTLDESMPIVPPPG